MLSLLWTCVSRPFNRPIYTLCSKYEDLLREYDISEEKHHDFSSKRHLDIKCVRISSKEARNHVKKYLFEYEEPTWKGVSSLPYIPEIDPKIFGHIMEVLFAFKVGLCGDEIQYREKILEPEFTNIKELIAKEWDRNIPFRNKDHEELREQILNINDIDMRMLLNFLDKENVMFYLKPIGYQVKTKGMVDNMMLNGYMDFLLPNGILDIKCSSANEYPTVDDWSQVLGYAKCYYKDLSSCDLWIYNPIKGKLWCRRSTLEEH